MYSISFPNMFSGGKTNLVADKQATQDNLRLVLMSTKTELFGDPDFGTNLKRFLYNQNSRALRDLIIDEIYTAIITYVPQIVTKRENIEVVSDKEKVYVNVKYIYYKDKITDMFTIQLTEE